jgi:hypothetical protein
VGSQRNFAYFQTELEVTNFREALQAVMHKKIFLDSYFLHFPSEKSSKHLLRFKKFKLREVYKKIDESKKILEYYQGIKYKSNLYLEALARNSSNAKRTRCSQSLKLVDTLTDAIINPVLDTQHPLDREQIHRKKQSSSKLAYVCKKTQVSFLI